MSPRNSEDTEKKATITKHTTPTKKNGEQRFDKRRCYSSIATTQRIISTVEKMNYDIFMWIFSVIKRFVDISFH